MSKKREFERLQVSLTNAISCWIDDVCEDAEVGYWPDDIAPLMAEAAMLVLKTSTHKEEWLMEEGHMDKQ